MPELTARVAAVLLASVFAWAAAAKVARYERWRAALDHYRLPRGLSVVASAGVPAIEAGVGALVVLGSARAGAALAIALLAGFSLAVIRARSIEGDRLPCGCFGGAGERDYRTLLIRNALLAVTAAIVLVGGTDTSPLAGFRAPTMAEIVPAVLVAGGLIIGAWVTFEVARKRGSQ